MPSLRLPASPVRLRAALLVVAAAASVSAAQEVLVVGKGGAYSSIQAAVDACPSAGCTIRLVDSVYELPRELWIEGKRNLAIEGAPALRKLGIRPRLHAEAKSLMLMAGTAANPSDPLRPAGWKRWPVNCKDTLGGSLDTHNPYSTSGYQYNGLIVIVSSRDIRIEGLSLDGLVPTYFGNKGIWDCKYDVMFGNVGVNLFQSRSVVLRDNEMRNFFSAVYIQNRNPGGAAASANSSDVSVSTVPRYSAYGAMGDHLVERNDMHHNWWAVYDELEWDLGSTFRFNRAASNANTKYGNITEFLSEADNMSGGFMFVKDVSQVIHRIHNNTIWGSPLVIGNNGYKYGAQHLFYNNIVGGFEQYATNPNLKRMAGDYRHVLTYYGEWLDDNVFEVRDSVARVGVQTISSGQVSDTDVCTSKGMLPPCFVKFDAPVTYRYIVGWPWPTWKVAEKGLVRGKLDGVTLEVRDGMATEQFPGGGLLATFMPNSWGLDVTAAANHWTYGIRWKSTTPGTDGFLEPDWDDSITIRTILGKGRKASGWQGADRGAVLSNHVYPEIWALRSQEPVLRSGTGCYVIPLRLASGSVTSAARISKVEAWSFVPMTASMTSLGATRRVPVRALADSSFSDGASRVVCVDTTPSATAVLRFQVELSSTTPSGTITTEPAYFQLDSPTADYSVGVSRSRPSAGLLRARWEPDGLVVRGLADGHARITVRTLDGRVFHDATVPVVNGASRIPRRSSPRETTIVTVEQEGRRMSLLAANFGAR